MPTSHHAAAEPPTSISQSAFLLAVIFFGAVFGWAVIAPVAAAQSPTDTSRLTGQLGTAGGSCQPWFVVGAPNPRTNHYLYDVDALAADEIWAVGHYYDLNGGTPDTTLAMRWNGTQWEILPTPPEGGYLNGVDALSPNDVWAVGHCPDCGMTSLTLHWDGVQWTRIPSPSPPGHVELHDVVALAPNNVWAVGANDGFHSTVAMQWDGNAWTIVPTPNGGQFGDDNVLTGITAVSPNDMWAVGYIYPKGGTPRTLSMRWNGSQWSLVTTPNPGNYARRLDSVDAVSANDVWAVGTYSTNSGETYRPLLLHWNGTQWQHVDSPEYNDYNSINAVQAIASDDVWAVGTTSGCNFCPLQTLSLHWNGTAWSVESTPNGFRDFSFLEGVTAAPNGDVWAVGYSEEYGFPNYADSLIMRKVCTLGTPTATPPGPPSTATPTRTPVPSYTSTATRTVAATPTCNPNGMRVLIVYADYETPPATLRDGMLSQPGVETVDFYRADSTTPPLPLLLQYDVVVVFANLTVFADPFTLGNRLADYQDAHGIVVAFHYSWDGTLREVTGRWQSGGYSPYEQFGGRLYQTSTLGAHNAAHPLMQGVANLSAFYRGALTLKPGAEQIAAWADGRPLIAAKGRAVGVSAYVGDEDDGWSGDFARIVVNAGRWLRANPCTGTPQPTQTPGTPSPTRSATVTRTSIPTATPGGPPYCTVPSFGPDTEYAVGNAPERVTVADFNEDGNPDVAVVNKDSANLSVLLGNGDGTLQPAVTYELDVQPSGITTGDYNGDGNLDIATAGFGARMAVILSGNGSGGFGTAATYGSGSSGAGIATADFNEDGSPDLVIADDGHDTMLVLLNNGSGGFGVGTQYNLDWIPTDIAVGDFNRDGNIDAAAPNSFSNNVSVRLGNGNGTFGPLQNFGVGPNPRSIVVADFNRDSNPDLAVSSGTTGNLAVKLGNGAGGFGTTANFPAGNGSQSIGVADFNGDENPDVAVANVPGNVAVLLGNGSGGFGPLNNFAAGSGPAAVAVGDFNRDAKPDLTVSNNTGDSVSVLLNTCSVVVSTPTNFPSQASATATQAQPTSTTAAATGTTVAATATRPASTAVSTATRTAVAGTTTPTACSVSFSDVPSDHTFYANVMCLACRGIISGYADGTFRPANPITRGQIAKVVSNAAGLSGTPTGQRYEDVPDSHSFYIWIERLSDLGVMGGYPCGSQAEPCGPAARPYFRPQNNATRGQLSKIVSEAAGLSGTPSGQTYADVDGAHPFYLWIERLTSLGVMSGYPCGSPGEPCDPQSRPYFRPGNDVTRGQASKIVANTFFTDCTIP
jgi:hypothetical protein